MGLATYLFLATVLAGTGTADAGAQATATRQSPSYTVQTPDGRALSLDSYRGRVVLLLFLNTECLHCQKTSQMVQKLQASYGDTQVQTIGVAINVNAVKLVPYFIERLGLSFPIGIDTQANARKYLGIPATGVVMPPVLVIIDRAGMIHAEIGGETPAVDDEAAHRAVIDKLIARETAQTSSKP